MPTEISILINSINPRISYTFKLIFKEILGFDKLNLFSDETSFTQVSGIKLTYGIAISGLPYLKSTSNLLFQQGTAAEKPGDFCNSFKYPCFYHHEDKSSILPFDFPALAFWLSTRYEEYQPFIKDKQGRFPATESYAFKNNFLNLPLIDLWAFELRELLMSIFPNESFPNLPEYRFIPTYDIDYAWAYKNRPVWRHFGAFGKAILKGNFNEISERIAALSGKKEDPYFNFSYIRTLDKYRTEKPIFFWLLGDYGPFDKNTDFRNSAFRKLISEICSDYAFGIHPSYASNSDPGKIKTEIERLYSIVKTPVHRSRQHFLKLTFPETYRNLLKTGITDDYTMGFAEQPGFRASTARAFCWYDLLEEKETELRIHPFMLMDVTLNVYLKKSPEEALKLIAPIIEMTKSVRGELISIWHNNSFCERSGWEGWTKCYEDFLAMAEKK